MVRNILSYSTTVMAYKNPKDKSKADSIRQKSRRDKWIKENGPCRKCGTWNNLEVDHVDPTLKITHRLWSYREELRTSELEKCQVLCSLCHLEKTKLFYAMRRNHGTPSAYKYGCRCDACREACRNKRRLQRDKNRKNAFSPRARKNESLEPVKFF